MQDMSVDVPSAEVLSKLTVPQLKAICKDKKISAYSKLQKAAIITKILDYSRGEPASSILATSALQDVCLTSSKTTEAPVGGLAASSNVSQVSSQEHASHVSMIAQENPARSVNDIGAACYSTPTPPNASLTIPRPPSSVSPIRPELKRKAEMLPLNTTVVPKKRNVFEINSPHISGQSRVLQPLTPSVLLNQHTVDSLSLPESGGRSVLVAHPPALYVSTALDSSTMLKPRNSGSIQALQDALAGKTQSTSTRKRFVPLVVKKTEKSRTTEQDADSSGRLASAEVADISLCTYDLDFDNPHSLPLMAVPLPPSLSQRKHVSRLSLAFCSVSLQDLNSLARCSRLFRYAVYISAVQRLIRDFSGRRLNLVMKQYSPNTTNMWPYLRARQKEYFTRKNAFLTSFLGKAFPGRCLISSRLWTSPDNVKQATIAVRFLLTRFFFDVSIGLPIETTFTIVDVQEVVEGEIWSVEIHSSRGKEIMYVLEGTCEVIGHPQPRLDGENAIQNTVPLRADWSAYVYQKLTRTRGICPSSLMERLKWANYEEYHRGISKLWLSRIEAEGELGVAKRTVAERYVLACVTSNSISGRWMSSIEMAQESNGLPAQIHRPSREDAILHLFLPAHHHVESVHFTSLDRTPLHRAVAVVQTPGREYFILKDNGMQIGCEEDGIGNVWMQFLQCDASGRAR